MALSIPATNSVYIAGFHCEQTAAVYSGLEMAAYILKEVNWLKINSTRGRNVTR